MTSKAFDRLLYTDCRPGTGRGGGGGFQVQAQSAGVDAAQSKMAVGWLLYEVQNAWIMQRRAIQDFPLGFAHADETGYGTAQGRYLGKEAVGGRSGNHLTDCLLTRDADLYGPTRPAQLWRSPLWRDAAWDSQECPQFEDILPLGPLTVEAIAKWLRDRPERAPILARMLSVLEHQPGRRIVITAAGPDEALRWIAATTLLLPVRRALEVSFKVFSSNVLQARQRIVAVPSELNPQIVPGRGESAFVLDADGCISDDTKISRRARFWVDQFADALGSGHLHVSSDAILAACAIAMPGIPVADPSALVRWLTRATPELLHEHGPSVVNRILAVGASADALRWIDTAATLGQMQIDRIAVRKLLLNAEVTEVGEGRVPPSDEVTPLDIGPDARRDADSELSSAIALGSDAEVNVLLCLAHRHGIELYLPPLRDRLRTFAIGWIDDPTCTYSPGEWALREEILDLVHDELEERLAELGIAGTREMLWRLRVHFMDRKSDPTDPVDRQWQVAEISAQPSRERRTRLRSLLESAMDSPEPATAVADFQRSLLESNALGPAEAFVVLTTLPDSLPIERNVIKLALQEAERTASTPTNLMLESLAVIDRRRLARLGSRLSGLLSADHDVQNFVWSARSVYSADDVRRLGPQLADLAKTDPAVVHARCPDLLRACLDCPVPGLGTTLLGALQPAQSKDLVDLWERQLARTGAMQLAFYGASWAAAQKVPQLLKARIRAAIDRFESTLTPSESEQWTELVAPGMPKTRLSRWLHGRSGER